MRVLIDCTPLSKGGGLQVAIALFECIRTKVYPHFEFHIVVTSAIWDFLPKWCHEDIRFTSLLKRNIFDFGIIQIHLHDLVRQFNPDLVFTVFGPAYFKAPCRHLVGFAVPRLIYSNPFWHNGLVNSLKDYFSDLWRIWSFRRADHLLVETDTVKKRCVRTLGFDPNKISIIPNGVNPLLINSGVNISEHDGIFRIIIPSAYYPHKNLEFVVSVARKLRMLDNNKYRFIFTLRNDDHHWINILENAKSYGLDDWLEAVGIVTLDRLSNLYHNSNCVFLPTRLECSTAVYPEAFFFERPLITSDLDFARELCGDAAIFVSPDDPVSAARAIYSLSHDPQLAHSLIDSGRQRLKNYPSAEQRCRQQMELFTMLTSNIR